jgi:glycosyltransferase involved in cell wall biosynthesis
VALNLAPIILFAYKRLDTLQRSIEALKQNVLASESELHIFSDGPRSETDADKVSEVRNYLNDVRGFREVHLHFSARNKGLSASIIEGVTEVFLTAEKVIVLEDDLVVSKNFLLFMNQCLEEYEKSPLVFSVTGYNYPFRARKSEQYDAYFLPRCSSYTWGTWKNRWQDIDWPVSTFREFMCDKVRKQQFNRGGGDLVRMLRKQQEGKIDSWAIRWTYNQFLRNSLTLYPIISKVRNIGFAPGASNTNVFNRYSSPLDDGKKLTFTLPALICSESFYHRQLRGFYSVSSRLKNRIRTKLYKFGLIQNKP